MRRQVTLFQTWGSRPHQDEPSRSTDGLEPDEDDEDLLLAMAMEESLKDLEKVDAGPGSSLDILERNKPVSSDKKSTLMQKQLELFKSIKPKLSETLIKSPDNTANMANMTDVALERTDVALELAKEEDEEEQDNLDDVEDLPGFDKFAGRRWIYPTNYPVRAYQYSIVKEALFKNTLVVLPTGLGKTFIAAVVMYNYYRWYPQGKIIFMAPTKPLVAQQIEACYNIMGIPQGDTAEMTGAMQPAERQKSWRVRRVFFLTPQVLTNDLSRSACPADLVKCLVIDEAHKALGNHAYCQVVRELVKHTPDFRVLALSATPGSDIKAVQQVLTNLLISHVELRSEDSADLVKYTHERKVEKYVIPLGAELKSVRDKYLQILEGLVSRLKRYGVIYNRDAKSLSKFLILKARDAFRQNPPSNLQQQQFGSIEGDFALCMSLYHGYELLQLHGLCSLFSFLDGIISGDKASGRTRSELLRNTIFCDLLNSLRQKFNTVKCMDPNASFGSQATPSQMAPIALSHPKMERLEQLVIEHFTTFKDEHPETPNTSIMIFSQYRDSVNEITEMLNRHRPLVKVMSFVGQSSAGKSSRGFTQKEQLKVMKKFREGGHNTLVSTCVGEEGLDIGDVDLIICFDAHKSPIRLVQRMGRTGRKREGRIVMLVTEGKEEQIYNQSQYNKRTIHKAIVNGARSLLYYPHNPVLIPAGLRPVCHKMHITVLTKFEARRKGRIVANTKSKTTPLKKSEGGSVLKTGFLSTIQLKYWAENYRISKDEMPYLPESEFVSSKFKKTERVHRRGVELSLEEWTLWQNVLQYTEKSGHSELTQHYVELMQFTDLLGVADDGDDTYGQEMALYLNEEDIIRPDSRERSAQHGILKFCSKNKGSSLRRGGEKSVLPQLDDDQLPRNSDDDDDDDDDLPTFDQCLQKGLSACQEEMAPCSPVHTKNKGKSGGHGRVKNWRRDIIPVGGALEASDRRLSDELTKDGEIETVRNKRRNTSGRIEMICVDDDDDDFMDVSGLAELKPREERSERKCELFTETEEDEKMNIELKCNSNEELQGAGVKADIVCAGVRNQSLVNLLPLEPGKTDCSNTSVVRPLRLKTPPNMDDLTAAFAEMDRKGRISPIDVLGLVEGWTRPPDGQVSTNSETYSPRHDQCVGRVEDQNKSIAIDDNLGNNRNYISQISSINCAEIARSVAKCVQENANGANPIDNDMSLDDILLLKDASLCVKSIKRKVKSSMKSPAMSDDAPDQCVFGLFDPDLDESNDFLDGDDFNEPFTCEVGSRQPVVVLETPSKQPRCDSVRPSNASTPVSIKLPQIGHGLTKSVVCGTPNNSSAASPSSLRNAHNSFFAEDDSILGNVACHGVLYGSDDQRSITFSQSSPQITFTQAMACMNSSKTSSSSGSDSCSRTLISPNQTIRQSKIACNLSNTVSSRCEESQELNVMTSKLPVSFGSTVSGTNNVKDSNSGHTRTYTGLNVTDVDRHTGAYTGLNEAHNTVASSRMEQPQFDLGFDFDLDDFEDDIIPPSPEHVIRPLSSQRFAISMMKPSQTTVAITTETPDITDAYSSTDKFDEPSANDTNNDEIVTDNLHTRRKVSKLSRSNSKVLFAERTSPPVLRRGDATESKPKPVAIVIPSSSQGFRTQTDFENPQILHINDDVYRSEEDSPLKLTQCVKSSVIDAQDLSPVCDAATPVGKAALVPWDPDGDTMAMDWYDSDDGLMQAETEGFEDFVSDDADESIIQIPQKKSIATILDSPDTPNSVVSARNKTVTFKTPVKPVNRNTTISCKRLRVSSEEESPVIKPKAKRVMLNSDSSFDDDFVCAVKQTRKSSSEKECEEDRSTRHLKPARHSKKKKRPAAGFIEDEAELSGSGQSSSDESDGSDLDYYEASFVNDCTQMSQAVDPDDMHAVYLQSVRSPVLGQGRVKLAYGRGADLDVLSQVPQQDTEYEQDSFCVNSDYEESEYIEFDHEPSVLERRDVKQKRKQQSKFAELREKVQLRKGIKVEASTKFVAVSRRLTENHSKPTGLKRRIILCIESSSEEEIVDKVHTKADFDSSIRAPRSVASTGDESPPLPSLRSRLQNKLCGHLTSDAKNCAFGNEQFKKVKPTESNKPLLSGQQGNNAIGTASTKVEEKATFSLGLDNLGSDFDDDDDIIFAGVPSSRSLNSEVAQKPSLPSPFKVPAIPSVSPPGSREERIRLSRLKQEEFRKNIQNQNYPTTAHPTTTYKPDLNATMDPGFSEDTELNGSTTSFTSLKDKLVILIDSREISSAQDLVSTLRFKHNMLTAVRSIGHCDYIISNRMAVERKCVSDFTNGAHRQKLVERLTVLCELFDRPCLIVEKDRVKPGNKEPCKPFLCTKYVEIMVASIAQTHIKLLYSDNQEHSAALIADLCLQEKRKHMEISINIEINPSQEQMLKFYLSLPKVSYIFALNLLYNFKSVAEFMKSPEVVLEKKGRMSRKQAHELYVYLRHTFDSHMLKS